MREIADLVVQSKIWKKRQISAVVRVNICFINPCENVKVFFVSKIETRGSKKTPAFKLGWIIDVVGRHLTNSGR